MIIILELLNSSTACSTAVGVGDGVFSQRGFDKEIFALVSSRVSHTCSPFALPFIHSYPVYNRDCCRGTCAAVRGFQPESPNHSLCLQISIYLRNPGTILIIGIILQYPVIIRSDRSHPEQLSSVLGSRGHEQLHLQNNSLACLETSEFPHVLGVLSGTGRLSVLQIISFIGHLLH